MSVYLLTEMARAEREAEGIEYGWIITKDLLADEGEPTDAGTAGPRWLSDALEARLTAGEGLQFRMLDDDGEDYYHGLYIGPGSDDSTGGELDDLAFMPMDDFGGPNAGCTEIQYRLGGKWVTL